MMKKIIPILLVLLIGIGGYFKYQDFKHPSKDVSTETTSASTSTQPKEASSQVTETTANVQVDQPIGGVMKGVIEVGASGFNSFVVLIDKDKNWELVDKQFGESLAYEGFATTEDVKTGLKKYLSSIFSKGVSGRNVHFVISSGALKNPKTELIAKSIEQMGYVVNRVTAEQEGKYALKALLPKAYRNNSFTVDIGSGNTKINWYENGNLKSVETHGAKYYQNNIPDAQAASEVFSFASKVPQNLRENCFIIGGVPFQLAKENKGNGRFTRLLSPDEYNAGTDVKMKSGLNIYKSIVDATQVKQTIFDWDANFTIGFLMSIN